jgi:hypothetical protein
VKTCLRPLDQVSGGSHHLLLESFSNGHQIIYNNSSQYTREDTPEDSVNRSAQAFSHFTFERSKGQLMVVSLEGVGNLLNDCNLGEEGFKWFFAMHFCNNVCHQLGLISNRDMALLGEWQFRELWPIPNPTICCSNKFCQSVVDVRRARRSFALPGYSWCEWCWEQLEKPMSQRLCPGPGKEHNFGVCKFFYASQGKIPPHMCPKHLEDNVTDLSAAALAGIWR